MVIHQYQGKNARILYTSWKVVFEIKWKSIWKDEYFKVYTSWKVVFEIKWKIILKDEYFKVQLINVKMLDYVIGKKERPVGDEMACFKL